MDIVVNVEKWMLFTAGEFFTIHGDFGIWFWAALLNWFPLKHQIFCQIWIWTACKSIFTNNDHPNMKHNTHHCHSSGARSGKCLLHHLIETNRWKYLFFGEKNNNFGDLLAEIVCYGMDSSQKEFRSCLQRLCKGMIS